MIELVCNKDVAERVESDIFWIIKLRLLCYSNFAVVSAESSSGEAGNNSIGGGNHSHGVLRSVDDENVILFIDSKPARISQLRIGCASSVAVISYVVQGYAGKFGDDTR